MQARLFKRRDKRKEAARPAASVSVDTSIADRKYQTLNNTLARVAIAVQWRNDASPLVVHNIRGLVTISLGHRGGHALARRFETQVWQSNEQQTATNIAPRLRLH
jgi:hypothetical protein